MHTAGHPVRLTAITVALVAMLVTTSSSGTAEGGSVIDFRYDDNDDQSTMSAESAGPSSTNLYGADPAESSLPSSAAANPANCTTTADNPHPSAHVPGNINAVVRQSCPVIVDNNSTEAKLWERRWWGYDVIGGPAFSDLTRSRTSQVNVAAPCRVNSIRVTGYGHYSWGGQHIMSQEVSNTKDVAC